MFNDLTALGYGLVVFAIIIGVGTVVLYNFSGAVADCTEVGVCGDDASFNLTGTTCSNSTHVDCGTPTANAYTNTVYLNTQLGSTGLAGWAPAIIAMAVGLLFLGAFMLRGGRKKGRY